MAERRRLTVTERHAVYDKMHGHCAYCGCELKYEDMQVDHVVPLEGWNNPGSDTLDNMLPACRSCNHYKARNTLDGWRKQLEAIPNTLMRDDVTYKNGVRFGVVTPTPHRVKFYFEGEHDAAAHDGAGVPAADDAGAADTTEVPEH